MPFSLNRTAVADILCVGLLFDALWIGLLGNPASASLQAGLVMSALAVVLACYLSASRRQIEGKTLRGAIAANEVRLLACVCFATSLLLVKHLQRPFIWIDLLIAMLCCWIAYRRRPVRLLFVNAAAVLATLAASEAWFSRSVDPKMSWTVQVPAGAEYFQRDPVLGETVRPNVRAVYTTCSPDGSEILRATYTINARGLRVTPERESAPGIVFFGCSFTFGDGVDDESSMPYRAGVLQPAYQAYNFGFHGYGPHQMLAAIESGKMERLVTAPPKFVIYQMIPQHVGRVANRVPYQRHAPAYGIVEGQVRLLGHFDERWPSLIIRRLLRKSSIYGSLIEPRLWTNADVELAVAVIMRARALIGERFPDCEFHVVFWDLWLEELSQKLLKKMRHSSFNIHSMSDILPNDGGWHRRFLIPRDGHPNAEAHDLIARYVCSRIVESSTKKGGTVERQSRTTIRTPDEGKGG